MEKTITVKWIRSTIGRTEDQKKTIWGLGFKRLHQTLILPDRPEIRGMINRVRHLVEVNPSTFPLEGGNLPSTRDFGELSRAAQAEGLRVDPERCLTPPNGSKNDLKGSRDEIK
jgi:large subunit ribosomal protein L30